MLCLIISFMLWSVITYDLHLCLIEQSCNVHLSINDIINPKIMSNQTSVQAVHDKISWSCNIVTNVHWYYHKLLNFMHLQQNPLNKAQQCVNNTIYAINNNWILCLIIYHLRWHFHDICWPQVRFDAFKKFFPNQIVCIWLI